MVGTLFAMGGFVLQLSGADMQTVPEPGAGSTISQAILAVFYGGAGVWLLRSGIALPMLTRAWPVFVLPCLALISAMWAPDPGLTLRRGLALLGTITFGVSLAAVFSMRTSLNLLIRMLVAALALSVIWVFAFPAFGVHQASDAIQAVHVGKWRGIFAHKNFLGGQVASLAFALLVLYGGVAFESLVVRLAAIALAAACLVGADSGAGYALAAAVTGVGLLLSLIATRSTRIRAGALWAVIGAALIVGAFAEDLMVFVLGALGKNSDLTGRTEYWNYVLALMKDHWTFGYGYFSGFLSLGDKINDVTNLDFSSTHNGYLDLIVSFGLPGLIAGGGFILWLIAKGIALILSSPSRDAVRAFPLCATVYALQHNIVESTLLAGNTTVPLVLAIAAGMLAHEGVAQHQSAARRRGTRRAPNAARFRQMAP
jgi:O-antigen ligase